MKLRVVLLALTLLAVAIPASADDPLDEQVRAIGRELQCPVCQSISVADSPADLAQQMRAIIRKKLEQGESREAIIRYFTDRYGEGILVEPPKRGVTLLIWLVPLLGLVAGAGIVYRFLRRRTAPEAEPEPEVALEPELARYQAELDRELAGLEGEAGR